MKGFFIVLAGCATAAGCKLAGCKLDAGCKLAGCVLAAGMIISCSTAPAPFRVEVPEVIVEQEYSGEYCFSVDFYNDSDKAVVSLEIAVPAADGYLLRRQIDCSIPAGGSTRIEVLLDDEPAEPVTAAVTEIVYEDDSRFFDPGGRESGLWW